jgi:hypothetical protein
VSRKIYNDLELSAGARVRGLLSPTHDDEPVPLSDFADVALTGSALDVLFSSDEGLTSTDVASALDELATLVDAATLSAGNSITLTAGVIDTIQDIRTSATPTFAGLNTSGSSGAITARNDSGTTIVVTNAAGSDFAPLNIRTSYTDFTISGVLSARLTASSLALFASAGGASGFYKNITDGFMYVSGGTGSGNGAQLRVYGGTHASKPNTVELCYSASSVAATANASGMTISGTLRSNGIVGFGRAPQTNYGLVVQAPATSNLGLSIIESTGAATISLKPNVAGSGSNLITSDYFSGSTLLPLHLSARGTLNDFVVATNGNIGIGTAIPQGKLDLFEDDQHLTFLTNKKLSGSWPPSDELATMTIQSSGSEIGSLAFATGNNEHVRITASGNVGIGTASPAATLHVVGSISFGTYTTGTLVPGSAGYITITDSGGTTRRLVVA